MHPLAADAAQCLGAFYEGIKHNKSITSITLTHWHLNGNFPVLDFETFMQNNKNLSQVDLATGQDTLAEDALNIARAIESTSVKMFKYFSSANNEWLVCIVFVQVSVTTSHFKRWIWW
jgi:hypothetical protein